MYIIKRVTTIEDDFPYVRGAAWVFDIRNADLMTLSEASTALINLAREMPGFLGEIKKTRLMLEEDDNE